VPANGNDKKVITLNAEIFALLQQRHVPTWDAVISFFTPQLRIDLRKSLRKQIRGTGVIMNDLQENEVVEEIITHAWGDLFVSISRAVFQGEAQTYHFFRGAAIFCLRRWLKRTFDDHNHLVSLDSEEEPSPDSIDADRLPPGADHFSDPMATASAETIYLREHQLDGLTEWLLKLDINPVHQEILLRHYLRGESIADLAEKYHYSEKDISQNLRRVCRSLRPFLK